MRRTVTEVGPQLGGEHFRTTTVVSIRASSHVKSRMHLPGHAAVDRAEYVFVNLIYNIGMKGDKDALMPK